MIEIRKYISSMLIGCLIELTLSLDEFDWITSAPDDQTDKILQERIFIGKRIENKELN